MPAGAREKKKQSERETSFDAFSFFFLFLPHFSLESNRRRLGEIVGATSFLCSSDRDASAPSICSKFRCQPRESSHREAPSRARQATPSPVAPKQPPLSAPRRCCCCCCRFPDLDLPLRPAPRPRLRARPLPARDAHLRALPRRRQGLGVGARDGGDGSVPGEGRVGGR